MKLGVIASVVLLSACGAEQQEKAQPGVVSLRLIQTSDIHSNVLGYDYYQNKEDRKFGLSRTAVLIREARAENPNNLLLDNGDLIQGSPLADYIFEQAGEGYLDKQAHPVFKAMNELGYDAGNLGNHEFNYGLEYLGKVLQGAKFPYVNANVFAADTFKRDGEGKIDWSGNKFTPYLLLERQVKDNKGQPQTVKVGILGLTPPQVLQWDKRHLQGKVVVADMVETANHYIPELRAKGADLVVVVAHTGINAGSYEAMMENAAWHLAKVEGIDALMLGHAHKNFPGDFPNLPEVDNQAGTLSGVPTVMPGFWGNHLGIIDLKLEQVDGKWRVKQSQASLRQIDASEGSKVDARVTELVKADHEGTNQWLDRPLGKITNPIHSFFALVQDDPSVQLVSDAQRRHAEQLQKDGLLKEPYPILSAAAPFRGGRNGITDFTYVSAGDISLRNVSDLYIYPNTLQVVEVNGATVKEWLEMSAGQFNRVDPASREVQWLVNESFPTYNFDVIDGVSYEVDIIQPARYNKEGVKVSEGERIGKLTFNGKPVDPAQKFYVVTNNYRASGGGHFPGGDGGNIVHEDPFETREIVAQYLKSRSASQPQGFSPVADNNWHMKALPAGVDVRLYSSPREEAKAVAGADLAYQSTLPMDDEMHPGYAIYRLVRQ
ncbi:bifunctional 2',3'-cyclic-nucleotide 2'-phosphodiesterase/3'-nucleotidase [Aeromonas enteropelogenes]|uniref:bifunctional 2',3'-cyclic-nucleotide 2'-phosphodiesterase/3'-nucleotidase n=1 Tax=Aeromonas enteropelogenes TaxID=29489 RepID=UPI00192029FF|nr:bifunctional 2',3'-cyclic-nucleotide 2'-phosphodiesterase/3'-nucleotidase [Aeromonas enteropelogenes]MBL0458382.1 bifunctional 2',3'-cyclic-nucleotide 2'-phosphodiesterase/3'-nucleotidase [Aeromonas enteropelogenes]